MFEVDNDVKRKVEYAQPRVPGVFFKSGCSVAPRSFPKGNGEGWGKRTPKAAEPVEPLSLYLRRLSRQSATIGARNSARAMGIPTRSKD